MASVYLTSVFGELALTAQLRSLFPALYDYSLSSPQDVRYNCIAWAAGADTRWWEPHPDYYWPPGAPISNNLAAFIAAFGTLGYECCEDGTLEGDFEKIAVYQSPSGRIEHMARQLRNGRWTSKLGRLEDIEHASPDELEGSEYGTVVQYMRRAVKSVTG